MRIGLVHAVAVAMAPIAAAFQQAWPEAELANLLDDRLSVDRAKDSTLTPAMFARVRRLADYLDDIGVNGILFTCSAFGEAIEAVARDKAMPVLKPNEAMFEAALEQGRRIGMLATFERSVASMEQEFAELAAAHGLAASIETVCVPDAMTALQSGDGARHNALLAEAVPRLAACDAIMLAQFSTSVARDAVSAAVDRPVLTSPDSAVAKLKVLLGDAALCERVEQAAAGEEK